MSKSMPMPANFADKFEWAAAWVAENGVTLPPDTPELRSLRNWFCFKVNQYRKDALGERNEALLAQHGIDLAEYEAPNTGHGERVGDGLYIAEMAKLFADTASYDLPSGVPQDLIAWRRRIMECVYARGLTPRLQKIEAALPGLTIGVWRAHGDLPVSESEKAWWGVAKLFRRITKEMPSYRGVVHPLTPPDLAAWAKEQMDAIAHLSRAQRGEMFGLGLARDLGAMRVRHQRETARYVSRGKSLDAPGRRTKDRRLTTVLGIAMYMRMRSVKSSPTEVLAAFGISPVDLIRLEETVEPLLPKLTKQQLTLIRKLYYELGEGVFDHVDAVLRGERPLEMPAAIDMRIAGALSMIREALALTRSMAIRQDIAVY